MQKTYSKSKDGNKNVSKNFKVIEFACKDGSDKIVIDTELVDKLQNIRDYFNAPVTINSGYRTASHNKAVGGASGSQHLYGRAADIVVKGIHPEDVVQCAETVGFTGIGLYLRKNFAHVDVRQNHYFWICSNEEIDTVRTFGGNPYQEPKANVSKGSQGESVRWIQHQLTLHSFGVSVDGIFGPKTTVAVRTFQQRENLVVDGIVGEKTRAALKNDGQKAESEPIY